MTATLTMAGERGSSGPESAWSQRALKFAPKTSSLKEPRGDATTCGGGSDRHYVGDGDSFLLLTLMLLMLSFPSCSMYTGRPSLSVL